VNLEGADREMARRVIDFASGMCYALSGTMEKVGSGVYLLKPAVSFDQPMY
jgi:cell division inhibitor SepF